MAAFLLVWLGAAARAAEATPASWEYHGVVFGGGEWSTTDAAYGTHHTHTHTHTQREREGERERKRKGVSACKMTNLCIDLSMCPSSRPKSVYRGNQERKYKSRGPLFVLGHCMCLAHLQNPHRHKLMINR